MIGSKTNPFKFKNSLIQLEIADTGPKSFSCSLNSIDAIYSRLFNKKEVKGVGASGDFIE